MERIIFLLLLLNVTAHAQIVGPVGGVPKATADADYVNITGDTMTGPLTLSGSTLTVTGNAFSVGTSTFSVRIGKVGIGTTAPRNALDVPQAISLGGATETLNIFSGAPAIVLAGYDGTNWNDIDIKALNATQLYIANSGNVGIGTTAPAYKLSVAGKTSLGNEPGSGVTGGASYAVMVSTSADSATNTLILLNAAVNGSVTNSYRDGDSTYGWNQTYSGATGKMTIGRLAGGSEINVLALDRTAGNVGIGTTAPSTSLQVIGTGITASTSTLSSAVIGFKGAVVTLSTMSMTWGDIYAQKSDNTLWMSTRTVVPADNDATCAGTVCYIKLSN